MFLFQGLDGEAAVHVLTEEKRHRGDENRLLMFPEASERSNVLFRRPPAARERVRGSLEEKRSNTMTAAGSQHG